MSAALEAAGTSRENIFSEQLVTLAQLPVELASVSEHQVLKTAIEALIRVYPSVRYIRILLVSQNYQPSELLEWCSDTQLTAAMANLSIASHTSQQAAMRRGMSLHTQQLQDMTDQYEDWCAMQHCGLQSFATVPVVVSGTVYGVISAGSPRPGCFCPRSIHLMETAAHMLAPYAAVLYKYQQITVTKGLLHQLLPARVVDAAIERLGLGNFSAADLFSNVNQDFAPD